MAKLPSFQFYPGDWLKDPLLRAASSGARGLWIDMLCLMWEAQPRGYLQTPSGDPLADEQIARMTGNCSLEEVRGWLGELESLGVFSRTSSGVIYSRRLVRDERKRRACQEAGKRGGNPSLTLNGQANGSECTPTEDGVVRLLRQTLKGQSKGASKGDPKGQSKGDAKGDANRNPTPSTSISSSASTSVLNISPNGDSALEPPAAALSPEATANHSGGCEAPSIPLREVADRITQAWNAVRGITPVRKWSEERKRRLRARLRDPTWLDDAMKAIALIPERPFLLGDNERGWRADIEWFLRPDSVSKVLEGKYSDTKPKRKNIFGVEVQ
jgi:hypothetical protein